MGEDSSRRKGETRPRRTRREYPIALHVINLNLLFIGGWLLPFHGTAAPVLLLALGVALNFVVMTRCLEIAVRASRALMSSHVALRVTVVLSTIVVLWGTLEYVAFTLTRAGVLRAYTPMMTVAPIGRDDWRLAHITADRYRQPDPVLLWRSIRGKPYNSQGFKDPVVDIPKPPDVVRIICCGDSNTDGPGLGGWPRKLQELLESHREDSTTRYEVLNAGFAGYSSHQGLLRFRQEVERNQPDVVTVSFGWNDAATTSGASDRDYRPPPAPLVGVQRFLLRYSFYLTTLHYLRRPVGSPKPLLEPRVSIDDYVTNLEGFMDTARARGCIPVFLTRPHQKEMLDRLTPDPAWRAEVPSYNSALIEFGRRRGAQVVDVLAHFNDRPQNLFSDDNHFTLHGQLEMARFLRQELLAREIIRR